jgi:sugar phosphate permease
VYREELHVKLWLGWQQVAIALFALTMGCGIVNFSYGIIVQSIGEEFHPSRTVLMLGIMASTLGGAVLAPFLGRALDQSSTRLVMSLAAASTAVGLIALSLVNAMWQVPVIYAIFLSAPVVALTPVGSTALLSRWFVRNRSLALGIAALGMSIGGFIFPPLIQHLMSVFEWRTALRIFGLLVLVVGVPAIFVFMIDRPEDRNLFPDGDDAVPRANSAQDSTWEAVGAGSFFKNSNFWFICLAVSLPMAVASGATSNLVPLMADLGNPASQAALAISLSAVAALLGTFSFALVGDRFNLRLILCVYLVLVAAGTLSFAYAHSGAMVIVSVMLMTFGICGVTTLWGALTAHAFGQGAVGRAMGLMAMISTLIAMGAPVLFGMVRDLSGTYTLAFLSSAAIVLVALLLALRIRVAPEQESSQPLALPAVPSKTRTS